MTGRHPASYEKYPAGHGFANCITITELLKKQGYRTGHFGKWHIGPDSTPGTYGIDEVATIGKSKDSPGRDDDLVSAALQFIEKNAKDPFYVNIWGHSTHFPVRDYPELAKELGDIPFDRKDFTDNIQGKFDDSKALDPDLKDSMRQYLADVYSIDKNMGRLLKTLDKLGIAKNTIVVFSSDQGPAPVKLPTGTREFSDHMLGYAGPLRGGKHEQLEGGVRVPFIIRWPGHIKAGRVDDQSVTSFIDWLPTLCAITGIDQLPKGLDGEDVSDIWLKGPRDRKTTLFWRASSGNGMISLRKGHWKFHEAKSGPLLYDLSKDKGEKKNVADQFPEVAKELSAAADEWRNTLPKEYVKLKDQLKKKRKADGAKKGKDE
jgi:N-acetylgalactosamine-6-sulfatase